MASPSPNSTPVGELTTGGWANWFISQTEGATYTEPTHGYKNNWWAYTEADNKKMGYVSEVYFAEGDNYERDASLPVTGASTSTGASGSTTGASGSTTTTTPPPQAPPGALGTPGAGSPAIATEERCARARPVTLRFRGTSAGTGQAPGAKNPGPAKAGPRRMSEQAADPAGAGGGGDAPNVDGAPKTIGTLQNCVHRHGDDVYGRVLLRLNSDWNPNGVAPLFVQTTLTTSGSSVSEQGSLSVEDPPSTSSQHQPGPNRYGDNHAWFLTRYQGAYSSGHADTTVTKPDRPPHNIYEWETAPRAYTGAATYEVNTKVLIGGARSFIDETVAPAGLWYAGWGPRGANRGTDLTSSWNSGPLRLS